jgi:hypothetical protein
VWWQLLTYTENNKQKQKALNVTFGKDSSGGKNSKFEYRKKLRD